MPSNCPPNLPEGIDELPNAYYEDSYGKVRPNGETEEESVRSNQKSLGNYTQCAKGSPEEWEYLVAALRKYRRKLLSMPGVTAVDLGYKIKNGLFTNQLALRLHVERKLPIEAFKNRPDEFILKEGDRESEEVVYLKLENGSVPMDVVEADYKLVAESSRPRAVLETPRKRDNVNRRKRLDPLVGGISIGSSGAPAGTLGALVWDYEDGSVCILSNWHVLAGNLQAEVGNPCYQPGVFDLGRSTDVVAHLKRWSFNRQTDAAIAQLNGSRRYSTGEILSMYQTIKEVAGRIHLGMRVHKSSRSSGHSWGFIDGLYFSAAMAYSNGLVRVFEEQIHIAPVPFEQNPISEPGDSGAVWVTNAQDEGYLAVGLHFAGDLPHSTFGDYALANPMSVVARRLNFSFRPLFFEIRDENVISLPTVQTQQNGIGIQPNSFVSGGTLTGSGGQPVSNPIKPGG